VVRLVGGGRTRDGPRVAAGARGDALFVAIATKVVVKEVPIGGRPEQTEAYPGVKYVSYTSVKGII